MFYYTKTNYVKLSLINIMEMYTSISTIQCKWNALNNENSFCGSGNEWWKQ